MWWNLNLDASKDKDEKLKCICNDFLSFIVHFLLSCSWLLAKSIIHFIFCRSWNGHLAWQRNKWVRWVRQTKWSFLGANALNKFAFNCVVVCTGRIELFADGELFFFFRISFLFFNRKFLFFLYPTLFSVHFFFWSDDANVHDIKIYLMYRICHCPRNKLRWIGRCLF